MRGVGKMKKAFLSFALLASTFLLPLSNVGATSIVDDVLMLQPDVMQDELLADVGSVVSNTGMTEEEVLQQIYNELKHNQEKGITEKAALQGSDNSTTGDTGGTVSVGSSTKGNFYYTPSQTAYLDHGHIGLYYASTTIVESVPSSGVRQISTTARKVDSSGAVVKSVSTSTTNRNNAANWAYSQIGQSYSYNFATNRLTGHDGAKNCSKLIWSAFKLHGNLDLDVDGGLGVYPRDVRDAPGTVLVRNI
jgi:uncharacterized protein YycO